MTTDTARPDTADHDLVMSWLQDREMKDNKLGLARNARARIVEIATAIGRLQDVAHDHFPTMDRDALDDLVRRYIDPTDRVRYRLSQEPTA